MSAAEIKSKQFYHEKSTAPKLAREAHDWRYKPKAVGATFSYFSRRVLRQSEECLH